MGAEQLREIVRDADTILARKDSIQLEYLRQEHIDAIAAAIHPDAPKPEKDKPAPIILEAADILKYNNIRMRDSIIPNTYTAIKEEFGFRMMSFFDHDIAHIGDHLWIGASEIGTLADRGLVRYSAKALKYAKITNHILPKILDGYHYPWKMLRRMALDKLGEPQQQEQVSLDAMFDIVSNIMASRFDAKVYQGADDAKTVNGEVRIVTDGAGQSVLADEGYLFSIIYNNLKNSMKKTTDEWNMQHREGNNDPKITFTASASCKKLNDQFMMLSFTDSGSGIEIDKMLAKVSEAIGNGKEMTWTSQRLRKRIMNWKDNAYAFNLLTLEDATDIAFMAQLTGATTPSTFSSGMGLYGTKYLIEQLGGAVLYATTFDGQHPLFSYIIPYEPMPNTNTARSIRKQLVHQAA